MADTQLIFDLLARDKGASAAFRTVRKQIDDTRDSTGALRRDTSALARAADELGASETTAGLAARRAMLGAAEAADKAAAAQRRAATAAEKLAAGEITEEAAARSAARSARELERASIAQAVAMQAAAKAAEDDAKAVKKAGADSKAAVPGLMAIGVGLAAAIGPGVLAPAVAGVAALGGGLLSAGLGAVAFGAVAKGALAGVTQATHDQALAAKGGAAAQQTYALELSAMSPAARTLMTQVGGLTTAWHKWQQSMNPTVLPVLGKGINLLRGQIPFLTPLVKSASTAFSGLITDVGVAAKSPFWVQLRGQLTQLSGPSITALGHAAGSVTAGIAGIFKAFLPYVPVVLGDIDKMTAGFGKWGMGLAGSTGMSKFMDYVRQNGPLVLHTIVNIGDALVHTVAALAGFSGPTLMGLQLTSQILASMPPAMLQAIAVGFVAVKAAMMGVEAVKGITGWVDSLKNGLIEAQAFAGGLKGVAIAEGEVGAAGAASGVKLRALTATMIGVEAESLTLGTAITVGLGPIGLAVGAVAAITYGLEQMGADANRATVSISNLEQQFIGIGQTGKWTGAGITETTQGFKDADTALAHMVSDGHAGDAAKSFAMIRDRLLALHLSLSDVNGLFPGYEGAVRSAAAASAALSPSQHTVTDSLNQVADASSKAAASVGLYLNAIQKLLDPSLAVFNDTSQVAAGMDALDKAMKKSHGSMSLVNAATRASHDAFAAEIKNISDLGAAQAQLDGNTHRQAGTVEKYLPTLWRLAGSNKEAQAQVAALASTIGLKLPAGIKPGEAGLAALKRAIDRLKSKDITVTTHVLTIKQQQNIGQGTGVTQGGFKAAGGLIRGPGTGTSDSVPLMGSNGEFMVTAAATSRNLPLLQALNAGADPAAALSGTQLSGSSSSLRRRSSGATAARHAATVATARQNAGAALLASLTTTMMSSTPKITSFFKTLNTDIRRFLSGGNEAHMLRWSQHMQTIMERLSSRSTSLAGQIKAAEAFATSTANTARGSAALTGLQLGPGAPTAGGIAGALQDKLGQLRLFAGNIGNLSKMHLSKDLLRQLLAAGPDQAGALATALSGGSTDQIKMINALQKQIDAASTKLGQTGANALYDSGRNAGKGFLSGLKSQQAALEAEMRRLGKIMADTLRAALKIHSPSQVMAELGAYVPEGLALGIMSGAPRVAAAAGALASASVPAIGVGRAPHGIAAAAAGHGGGRSYSITVQVAPGGDLRSAGRQIVACIQQYEKGNGKAWRS